ncbi:MAG TPA: NTP transferase domain-containing protein [Nitrososphaeraceae archaeon]|jgi:GTP:adenosylcobinamide-phosphate guanylyltransferase|nr:NTP transferase domain-containing protein [Nitrososphaeraceae archaeon]
MIALIMCGGTGSRFITQKKIEKPLACIRGKTLIERVLHAVISSGQFNKIVCVSSHNSPYTTELLKKKYKNVNKIEVIVKEGLGYSRDLSNTLSSMVEQKVFTFPSDLALLDTTTVKKLVRQCTPAIRNTCIAAIAERSFLSSVGLTCNSMFAIGKKEYCYTGVCGFYVGMPFNDNSYTERFSIMNEMQVAVNINTAKDLGFAEHLLDSVNQDCL